MLEIQYRMDPLIRQVPSSQFYEGRLKDDEDILTRSKSEDFKNGPLFPLTQNFSPIQFYDLTYARDMASETSKVNNDEVDLIQKLLWKMIFVLA